MAWAMRAMRTSGLALARPVLGDPVAVVAEAVVEGGEVEGVAEGLAAGGALRDGGLVEDAETQRGRVVRGHP